MKSLAILAVFVSLGIGSAAYLTTIPETRTVTIEIPYQVPVYEEVSVPYEEPVYKTVSKTINVQKTETRYKDETRYRTVTRYGSVTYYSGWLQIVYASKIYFSKATGANCEPAGLSIGVSPLYTCTIVGGPNAGTYTAIVLYNIDEETERVPQQVKEAYKVQVPYEVTVNVPETVQEQVIDHYETKYKTEKRIKGYETKHRTETGEVTKTKFEWLFSPKITSLDDNNIPKISNPTPTTTAPPAISYSETRVLKGVTSGNYYYKVIPEGFTIFLPSDSGGTLSFKVWNDQGICYYCNTDNTIYYSGSSLHLNTTAKNVNERFTSSIYNAKRELTGDDKKLLSQGVAGGETVEIKVEAGTSSVTLTTTQPNYNMFMEISDIGFTGASSKTSPLPTTMQPTASQALMPSLKRLKVVDEAFNGNVVAAAMAGLEKTGTGEAFENGYYYVVDRQGDKYVALNGKADKLAKLILEQQTILRSDGTAYTEKKALTVGETWDVGGGWQVTANSIDAKASPRQVWLTLSKDGVTKDDKVVAQGNYTYIEKSISGESDVPLFVTYIDSVFVGATSDMVQLKYTWAISPSITSTTKKQ